MADNQPTFGAAADGVRLILRLEGLALLALSIGAYFWLEGPWWLLLILFLAPDFSFIGYVAGPLVGAATYNAAHSTIGPITLLALGVVAALPLAVSLALIWAAHVGFDRALGYGLKYATGFGHTHLGRIGKR
jgi:hypothetical protein